MGKIEPAPKGLSYDDFIAWLNAALDRGDKVVVSLKDGWTIEKKDDSDG